MKRKATRKPRPMTRAQLIDLRTVEPLLQSALKLASNAECPALVEKIRSALASYGGAMRHAARRIEASRT